VAERLTTEQVGYRHRLRRAVKEMREAASVVSKVDPTRIDYSLLGDLDEVLRRLEGVTSAARKLAKDLKCPQCGYPTADGSLCGECLCEDDSDG